MISPNSHHMQIVLYPHWPPWCSGNPCWEACCLKYYMQPAVQIPGNKMLGEKTTCSTAFSSSLPLAIVLVDLEPTAGDEVHLASINTSFTLSSLLLARKTLRLSVSMCTIHGEGKHQPGSRADSKPCWQLHRSLGFLVCHSFSGGTSSGFLSILNIIYIDLWHEVKVFCYGSPIKQIHLEKNYNEVKTCW